MLLSIKEQPTDATLQISGEAVQIRRTMFGASLTFSSWSCKSPASWAVSLHALAPAGSLHEMSIDALCRQSVNSKPRS